jgi:hypothetical protein
VRPARKYNVGRLIERHGDARLTQLLVTLADRKKGALG